VSATGTTVSISEPRVGATRATRSAAA
jgi:hypothetical protein